MADLPTEAHPKKDFRPKSTKKIGPVAKNTKSRGPVKKAKEESPSRKKFLSKLSKMK